MEAKSLEDLLASSEFKKEQQEMQSLLSSIIGDHAEPTRPIKEVRQEMSRKLKGISVSQMIIESR
ncbi:MAG: hypothetical protein QF898_01425 [SAR202 cluster bacterium]|jgi:hypothetical protein|nr:hypothetical protein [SAR202 cluster bacterium]MDP6512298.1 hypothetical protein [SAR202 cluster bacterium]MDP6714173.1 hypothetical protein [SAR202 cluster bacterium]